MTKIDLAKKLTGIVVGAGTALIVKGFVDNNTDPQKLTEKVAIGAATIAIGAIAKDATRKYTDSLIDTLVETWHKATIQIKEMTD